MKKIFTLLFVLVGVGAMAQVQIVLQNGTKTEVYNNLDTLLKKSVAGDTIYLPGVGFSLNGKTITKKLHWIGTGHYPVATEATGRTVLNGVIYFSGKCDGTSLEGIYFPSQLTFGDSKAGEDGSIDECTDVSIKRCRINGYLYLRGTTTGSPSLNFRMQECVLTNAYSHIYGQNGQNCLIERCIIVGRYLRVHNFVQSQFKYNIMSCSGGYNLIYDFTACVFENNIFPSRYGLDGTTSCVFRRNLFNGSLPYSVGNAQGNAGSNNMVNVSGSTVFQNIKGSVFDFDYANDYHFKGFSGDTIKTGIYGGTVKYKANAVPFFPQLTAITVDENADHTTKKLGVKATVKGQKR